MSGQIMGEGNNSNHYSYHLTLFTEADEMFELWLPKITEGYYRFSNDTQHRFLSITAKDGQWYAVCQRPAYFKEVPVANSYEMPLCDKGMLKIEIDDRRYLLLMEEVIPQRQMFRNYNFLADRQIVIGNRPECDIYYNGPFVSERHAVLSRVGGQWQLQNFDRTYGLFVNQTKCEAAKLHLGDLIYIMGLKIIVGQTFLSINSGLGEVSVNPAALQETPVIQGSYSYYYNEDYSTNQDRFFNRAPRKRRESEQKVITVEGPPMSMDQNKMPLLLRMGGSMVMGGSAALAGNFMTLITSVMFPFLSSKYTESQRKEYEKLRKTKYTEYLEQKKQEILNAIALEQLELNQKYPLLSQLEQTDSSEHLWERRPNDSDFLQLRLGTGSRPLSATIEYPQRRFELQPDELEEKMYELVEAPYKVENAPIVLSLTDAYVCGMEGDKEQLLSLIRNLVMQTAVHHSYDEVKMVFLLQKEDLEKLDHLRYLPHVWDDVRSNRFVATNEAEAYAVGEYIKTQIAEEKEEKDFHRILKKRPYYVIFALDKKLFDGHEVFKQFLQADQNPGASVITAYNGLPKECQKIITVQDQKNNTCTTMGVDGGEDELFAVENLPVSRFNSVMHRLANTTLKQVEKGQSLPKMVTFLEMFKVGRVEQLNPLKRWRENNPVKSLAAPVGVGEDGEAFVLDLHEKRQGPHGLVAGMTGSGKSEFIISYILSMAVNYHPDEVAFVLIDYKGGGLADAFENPRTGVRLPHLAGTITNLDGASIQRSLMSIESELVRRQKVFSEVSKNFDEGSMNIYTYQKLYRAGKVSEPMPHLFIVSDEFAELKQQQPEFMEKLISAARIGRSLGVHLILATQKPSGVVNDQIRSNTKFRVCLRVQDRADSQDMLKRPEAAELTDTGRFYLQVGYNEYFALAQSAWCGADYEPQDAVPVRRDDVIEFLDNTGQVITKNKPKVKKATSGMKQIVAVVQYLSDLAKTHGVRRHSLWTPPLPKMLELDSLNNAEQRGSMKVVLGLLDDPVNQKQFPMVMDFETCQNMLIIGDGGTGKTTIMQNILYSLIRNLSPEDFNFYALDYSSRMLKLFKKTPHCGAILQEEDVGSLDEFFKLINSLIAERKQLFSELEVDSFDAARRIQKIPLIVVVIDNIAGLLTSKIGEAHGYKMQTYMKNSASYGIKYVVSCSHLNEVPSKVRQELAERICLHVRDKYAYSEILGCKTSYIPAPDVGRGLVKREEIPLEFQSAVVCSTDDNARVLHIKDVVESICKQYGTGMEAQRLSVVKDDVEYEEFAAQFRRGRIPLGYSKSGSKPVALPIKQMSLLSLYFGNKRGKLPILRNILYAAQREQMELWIIQRNENSAFQQENADSDHIGQLENADYLTCTVDNTRLLQQALVNVANQRKQMLDTYYEQQGIDPKQEDITAVDKAFLQKNVPSILLFIESVTDFCRTLNALSTLSYCKLFKSLYYYNIYVVGCFEPEGTRKEKKNNLLERFAQHDILLFGGNFDQQSLYPIAGGTQIGEVPFNTALMVYRKEVHTLTMPCGKVEEKQVDEDMQSIF